MQWSHCLSNGIQEIGNIDVLTEMWRDLQGYPCMYVQGKSTLEIGKMDTFKLGLI